MKSIFLQTTTIQKGTDTLFQYGVLGLFAIIMIAVIWYLEKQRRATIDEMKATMIKMEVKMDLQQQDHENFIKTEFKKSLEINEKCLTVLDEVRELLKRK